MKDFAEALDLDPGDFARLGVDVDHLAGTWWISGPHRKTPAWAGKLDFPSDLSAIPSH